MTTEILIFHDAPERSRANRALATAAAALPEVTVVEMSRIYPTIDAIDVDTEVARLLAADRLVLQFPIQWYSTPPLLKAWQDRVLTRMYYINPANEGDRLKGLPAMVAATAGNFETAYRTDGANGFPLVDLLRPLEATAHRCGWVWSDPHLVYRSNKLEDADLADEAQRYVDHLEQWIDVTMDWRIVA